MNATSESPPAVQTRGLTKVFRDFWHRPKVCAVQSLDLTVPAGRVFGLLGPNGSGKSTTIKMLLGLLHPTGGNATVLGRSPGDVGAKRRIGYLPEESYLYRYLSARETLDFYAQLFGLSRAERTARIPELIERVGLQDAGERAVGEYSKGMARRIGLAQALVNDPDLLVLDEPTAGLDPIGCRQVKDLIVSLAAQDKTIILSSHLLADVEDVCERIAILHNGHMRACGRVSELLREQHAVRFTLPAGDPETVARLRTMLARETGAEPRVEHPEMNLEQFFLGVVQGEADAGTAAATDGPDRETVAAGSDGK